MVASVVYMSSVSLFNWFTGTYTILLSSPAPGTKPFTFDFVSGFSILATLCVSFESVLDMFDNTNKKNYKLARLVNTDRPYVVFYAWNDAKNMMVRKRVYLKGKTPAEIKYEASNLIKTINILLKKGKTLKNENQPKSISQPKNIKQIPKALTFGKAINYYFENRTNNKSRKSVQYSMKSYQLNITAFFDETTDTNSDINDISKKEILNFLDYLTNEKLIKARTRNNYLMVLKTMFNWLIDREVCIKNPCKDISKITEQNNSHTPYSVKQVVEITNYLKEEEPQMYLFCMFIYYCAIRPNELRNLQIKHILPDKIIIPAKISKNEKTQYVTIPNPMQKIIKETNLRSYNPENYIFSKNYLPGKTQLEQKYFSRRYKAVKNKFNLSDDYTMYSWKHTGAVALFTAGFDIKYIQEHFRHSDIRMTDIYLKSLGLFRNDKIKTDFPEI
jgi:site-specific recombinase XerD